MQTIYLDISNRGVISVIYAKQNDVGRKVEVILTNSGLPYEPEAGSAFSAWYSGASGMGNYTDIGEKSAFSVSGNKVTVELITQMLQNAGEGILCLVLSRANGDQIGLWNIRYICEGVPGAGSEPANDYYTAFSQAVAGLPYPDASLSVAGKAADAAATGEALEGKAPAGYGLGSAYSKQLSTADDLNNCAENGFYSWALTPINAPFHNGMMIVATYDWARKVQYIWSAENGCAVQRIQYGTSWGEPEWVNPPMIPGVEYRTTERIGSKPVYVKRVSLGALPNASNKREVIVPTGSTIVGVDGYSVYTSGAGNEIYTPLVKTEGVTSFFVNKTTGQVGINTDTDLSTYTATVTIKYTK